MGFTNPQLISTGEPDTSDEKQIANKSVCVVDAGLVALRRRRSGNI